MQAINETNISTFSGHLFKPNDEQPDAADMHYSESGDFTDQE